MVRCLPGRYTGERIADVEDRIGIHIFRRWVLSSASLQIFIGCVLPKQFRMATSLLDTLISIFNSILSENLNPVTPNMAT